MYMCSKMSMDIGYTKNDVYYAGGARGCANLGRGCAYGSPSITGETWTSECS